jgi:hypothetical protein
MVLKPNAMLCRGLTPAERRDREFRICTAHPEARRVLTRRHLPATFRCPRADAACPMDAPLQLTRGRDVRFAACAAPDQEPCAHG